jgi:hypothetical protein
MRPGLASTLVVAIAACSGVIADAAARLDEGPLREREVVARALDLLPDGRQLRVKIIDPDLTGDPEAIRALDAFVVRERDGSLRQIVYLNRDSSLFQAAQLGSAFDVAVLAAVIHHESCHLRGFDEQRAFFEELAARGVVPHARAHAYLELMRSRQPRALHAP